MVDDTPMNSMHVRTEYAGGLPTHCNYLRPTWWVGITDCHHNHDNNNSAISQKKSHLNNKWDKMIGYYIYDQV